MFKHRIILTITWLLLSIALLVFHGHESKAFMAAILIGTICAYPLIGHPFAFFAVAILINGLIVFLFGLLFDKNNISRKYFILLYISIIIGCFIYPKLCDFTFKEYKALPIIAAATDMYNYSQEFLYNKYIKSVVIPTHLMGCVFGLYGAVALRTIAICFIGLKKRMKTTLTRQVQHTP